MPPIARTVAATAAAVGVLHLLLALPNQADAIGLAAFLHLPVELPLVLAVLCLLPAGRRSLLRRLLVLAVPAVLLLKLADMAAFAALGRPFDPVLDLHLAAAGWDLLAGAIGVPRAVAAATAVAAAVAATAAAADWSLRVLARLLPTPAGSGGRPWSAAACVAAMAAASVTLGASPPGAAAGLLLRERMATAFDGIDSLRDIRREAAGDAFAEVPGTRLLAGLAGRDVVLVFVESYGRSALEDPRYAPTVLPALDALGDAATGRGLSVRSGWLTAPMVGGQSWLAHGTLLSGLWVDGQRRYDSLVAGEPRSLVRDFGRAGWRTTALMPAITGPWPEGRRFGFDTIRAAADLGYRGAPFNWVTMPDQFTLQALQRLELDADGRPPVMAMLALVSSHAPWTPIPPVIGWEEVGDGSVFSAHARAGDPPDVVWRDHDRVRAQYAKAVAYVLRTLAAYVSAYGREDLLLVLVGDHQPAPLITGSGASFDVPIHIIGAGDAVTDAASAWGWAAGPRPGETPPWRMDAFRDRFLAAFTPAAETVSGLVPPFGGP